MPKCKYLYKLAKVNEDAAQVYQFVKVFNKSSPFWSHLCNLSVNMSTDMKLITGLHQYCARVLCTMEDTLVKETMENVEREPNNKGKQQTRKGKANKNTGKIPQARPQKQ